MNKSSRSMPFLLAAAMFCAAAIHGCASSAKVSVSAQQEASPAVSIREPIVLVCRIDTVTADEEISSLSFALAPLVRRDLFCVQTISVVPTTDTNVPMKASFLTQNGLRKLARAHGADIVTVGMLRGDSKKVEIELEAYDVDSDSLFHKAKIEGKTSRIFELQRKLVYEFIDALGITMTEEERDRLESSRPRKSEAAVEYGRGLKKEWNEEFTEALIALSNAYRSDTSFAAPHFAEARVFDKYNAPSRAMKSFGKAVAIDKYYAEAWYQLNVFAAGHKNRDDVAMGYCLEALNIAPRFGKARLSLGTRLYALGDLSGAIEQTKTAAELLRADPLSRYNLGFYYLHSAQPEEARKWFERSLKIDPGFERARAELLKLQGS